jgi:alkanesulfonate monooxygenase SsuD/methylene tetrahydromethanopterin reductase-like flavin-dependent oxidoreductase (luciferase family)
MLAIAARHADVWHGFGPPAELARKSALVDRHAEAAGRDPASIGRSTSLSISEPWDEVLRTAEALAAAGFSHLIASWPAAGRPLVEEFVTEVMPRLTAG